jgi:protein-S-isoprenylcysteine O-methyltransferase Ste14
MSERMPVWGVGPLLTWITGVWTLAAVAATFFWPSLFTIPAVPYVYLAAVAAVLLIVALPFYISSARTLFDAYDKGRLATTGVYAVCRNPIYAGWVLMILPAVALLCRSWLVLTASVVMYVATRILIRREEKSLEAQFGQEYLDYKNRVNAIFPTFRRLTKQESP